LTFPRIILKQARKHNGFIRSPIADAIMMRFLPASRTRIVSSSRRLPSRIYSKTTATRSLSFFQAGGPKLLLPTTSTWDNVWDAVQGCWSAVTDEKSRNDFETLIQDGVIRDQVLQNAVNGSSMTFGLFHQLNNPLWERHGFKAKEFVQAVGPALTNLHDVLHSLQNEFAKTAFKQEQKRQSSAATKLKDDDSSTAASAAQESSTGSSANDDNTAITLESITSALDAEYLQSGNLWRTRAHAFEEAAKKANEEEKDGKIANTATAKAETVVDQEIDSPPAPSADELASSLMKMTTPGFLDAAYLGWKLSMMALIASSRASSSRSGAALGGGDRNIPNQNLLPTYEEGSFQIGQVAILRARVMSISAQRTKDEDDGNEETTIINDATFHANVEKDNMTGSKSSSNKGTGTDDHKMDESDDSFCVAAQIDVLYEATSTFMELSANVLDPSSSSSSSADTNETTSISTTMDTDDTLSSSSEKANVKEDEISATVSATEAKSDATEDTDKGVSRSTSSVLKDNKPPAMDRIKVNSVGVAVLEGWFHGGPGPEKELRWRVAALRDPYEFPGAIPLHRTILSSTNSGKT
jgi:hypothetical protein